MQKKNIKRAKIVTVEIIGALFILLFIYAAVSKVKDFEKFEVQLGKSPLVNPFVSQIAWGVPILEISIALMLIIKRTQFIALYMAFTLMVVFSAYIIAILKFSSYIPCSCGGIIENMTWTQHLYFNTLFIMLGIIGVLLYSKKNKELIGHKRESPNPVS